MRDIPAQLAAWRLALTGIDWREVTEKQMAQWGVKYHELRFGKPAGDFYIDDRFVAIESLHNMARRSGVM